jgi:beta-fructofuranosidase
MTEPDVARQQTTVRPDDPHRPIYHFMPEANWLNDPNGLIQWQGRYHMFYQYNPHGPFHATIHWGHAVSDDLVHWKHLPIALEPSPDGPDRDGCWSGCAVDNNGVATLIYTGVRGQAQLCCVATSTDDLLRTWEKYAGNPVIPAPPQDLELVAYRDHSVWKEGDNWYQIIGAGIEGVGGTALLYRSTDLLTWEYLHPILVGNRTETKPLATGDMWECPTLFILNDKHVLIVSVWTDRKPAYCAYFVGDFTEQRFTPEHLAMLDNGGSFYAPQTLLDNQGRRLMWGWLQEQCSEEAQRQAGWSGVMSLPRLLTVSPDGKLAQAPVPELQKLRANPRHYPQLAVPAEGDLALPEIQGDCLEILLEFDSAQAGTAGLKVRCSPDEAEYTLITYDWKSGALVIDREHSSLNPEVPNERRVAPYQAGEDGKISLHIFLDRSVIEVFVNEQVVMASRIYPTRPDSLGLKLVANGGAVEVNSMDVWTMQATGN